MAIAIVATLWLAASGQLILYIHPRYVVFTVIMAVIGLVLVLSSVARRGAPAQLGAHADHDARDRDHDHDHGGASRSTRTAFLATIGTVLTLGIGLTLIVLPPATLSSATAGQREVNSTGVGTETASLDDASASSAAALNFSVLDWASLLRQTSDTAFYADKPADITGFITEDPEDPENMFFVSRFIITCCAVDAQPVGVPVYMEDWKSSFAADQWVDATGSFATNPSSRSGQAIVLVPDDLVAVDEPGDPYLF